MTPIKTLAVAASILTAGAVGMASAFAHEQHDAATDEAAIMANAKITMAQAIAAAEQAVGGKAVGTGIEDQDGTVSFEVEVLKDSARHKVLVDPQTGQVTKAVLATSDHENHEDVSGENGDRETNGNEDSD